MTSAKSSVNSVPWGTEFKNFPACMDVVLRFIAKETLWKVDRWKEEGQGTKFIEEII